MAWQNKQLFKSLPKKIEAAVKSKIDQGADNILKSMHNFVREDTGELKASLKIKYTGFDPKKPLRAMIYTDALHAAFVEFGTQGTVGTDKKRGHHETAAYPFFFPAYRIHKKPIKRSVSRAVSKILKEENNV